MGSYELLPSGLFFTRNTKSRWVILSFDLSSRPYVDLFKENDSLPHGVTSSGLNAESDFMSFMGNSGSACLRQSIIWLIINSRQGRMCAHPLRFGSKVDSGNNWLAENRNTLQSLHRSSFCKISRSLNFFSLIPYLNSSDFGCNE